MGGQFNTTPGRYSEVFLNRCAKIGFDAIFTAHSHTTQRMEYIDGMPCFFSMGNVTMSPCTFYQIPESLAEYGLAVHLYIDGKKTAEESGELLFADYGLSGIAVMQLSTLVARNIKKSKVQNALLFFCASYIYILCVITPIFSCFCL